MKTTIEAPRLAVAFALWKLTPKKGKNPEGKNFSTFTKERCYGEPDERTGQVADAWAVSEFDPKAILQRFGASRYQVEWMTGKGERVGVKQFVVDQPSSSRRRGASSLRTSPEPETEGSTARRGGAWDLASLGPMELLELMDRRADAERERNRADAEAQRDRDRQYFQQQQALMVSQQQSMMNMFATLRPSTPDAGAFDPNLIRREMAVTMREQMHLLRAEVTGMIPQAQEPDDPAPRNLAEATERVGIELVQELATEAPEFLKAAIPKFFQWMKQSGVKPSAKMRRKLTAYAQAQAAAEDILSRAPNGTVVEPEEEEDDEHADPQ